MKRLEQIITVACALVVTASLVVGILRAVQNPMHERLAQLEAELASVVYIPEEYAMNSSANYAAIVMGIARKSVLWEELVAPPVRKPKPKAPPNLEKMLKGVVASLRFEIESADTVSIKITTPENRKGDWMSVGDKINGLTIIEITRDSVLFTLNSGGEEYTYSLPRL